MYNDISIINEESGNRFNFIIMSMNVYNEIEKHPQFHTHWDEDYRNESVIYKVGCIGEFVCYLDLLMRDNEILLSWDKSTSRNIKIDNILDNRDLREVRIKFPLS